jgi:hypothetical protein
MTTAYALEREFRRAYPRSVSSMALIDDGEKALPLELQWPP